MSCLKIGDRVYTGVRLVGVEPSEPLGSSNGVCVIQYANVPPEVVLARALKGRGGLEDDTPLQEGSARWRRHTQDLERPSSQPVEQVEIWRARIIEWVFRVEMVAIAAGGGFLVGSLARSAWMHPVGGPL